MPRPSVHPAHSRAILLTSASPLHLRRNCHPPILPTSLVCTSKVFGVPDMRLIANPFVSNTCALFFSLAALFCTRFLCFQWFADSFAKYPGGGGIQTILGHRGRDPMMAFHGKARLAMVQNGRADK